MKETKVKTRLLQASIPPDLYKSLELKAELEGKTIRKITSEILTRVLTDYFKPGVKTNERINEK